MPKDIQIRALKESEKQQWSEHCEGCFSHKQYPPKCSYFIGKIATETLVKFCQISMSALQGNFDSDPYRVLEGIRVATQKKKTQEQALKAKDLDQEQHRQQGSPVDTFSESIMSTARF